MRKMSFESYLLKYAQELTGSKTASLKRLLELSLNDHSRALEPVSLLLVLRGKDDLVLKQLENTSYEEGIRCILNKSSDEDSLLQLLADNTDSSPLLTRYRKLHQAYRTSLARLSVNREAISIMREKMLSMMRSKGISNYRVYTDLSLNPGNINSFLKNNDTSKVSRKTARKMLDYVQSI